MEKNWHQSKGATVNPVTPAKFGLRLKRAFCFFMKDEESPLSSQTQKPMRLSERNLFKQICLMMGHELWIFGFKYINPERNRDCTGAAETRNKHRMATHFLSLVAWSEVALLPTAMAKI